MKGSDDYYLQNKVKEETKSIQMQQPFDIYNTLTALVYTKICHEGISIS